MNPYEKLLARKRKWTPVQTEAGPVYEGAEETIFRALALRHMELPVGDFITDALATEVPPLARELLLSNVRDEENHDVVDLAGRPVAQATEARRPRSDLFRSVLGRDAAHIRVIGSGTVRTLS